MTAWLPGGHTFAVMGTDCGSVKGPHVTDQSSQPPAVPKADGAAERSIVAPPAGSLRLKVLVGLLIATIVWYVLYLATGGGDFQAALDSTRRMVFGEDPRAAVMQAAMRPRHFPREVMQAGYGSRRTRAVGADELRQL